MIVENRVLPVVMLPQAAVAVGVVPLLTGLPVLQPSTRVESLVRVLFSRITGAPTDKNNPATTTSTPTTFHSFIFILLTR